MTAYVGTSLESVHEASRTLTRALLVGVPLVTALLGLATWLVLGRALRRVDAIRSEVDSITEAELHRRVPTSPVDDEVGRLAATMNGCSPGSRPPAPASATSSPTPPTTCRARWPRSAPSSRSPSRHPETSTCRRWRVTCWPAPPTWSGWSATCCSWPPTTTGAPPPAHVPLDLDDLVLEEAARLRPATAVHLEVAGVSAAPVRGDAGELRRLVRNLLENAARYAATTVRVTAGGGR